MYLVVNQAVLETVARVKSTKKNETKEEKYTIQFYLSFIFIYMTFYDDLELKMY